MNREEYLDLIEFLSLKGLNDLKEFLIEKRRNQNLTTVNIWLKKNISEIEDGIKIKLNASRNDFLEAELDRLAEETNIAFDSKSDNEANGTKSVKNASTTSIEDKFQQDLGWGNSDDSNEEKKAINDLIECSEYIAKKYLQLDSSKTYSSGIENKPHKETIYNWFRDFKKEHTVSDAFYALIEKIEGLGLDTSDYIETDDPQNFNASYNKWYRNK